MMCTSIKYPTKNMPSPVTPLLRVGYCRNDKNNSMNTKSTMFACNIWFNQLQKKCIFKINFHKLTNDIQKIAEPNIILLWVERLNGFRKNQFSVDNIKCPKWNGNGHSQWKSKCGKHIVLQLAEFRRPFWAIFVRSNEVIKYTECKVGSLKYL